MQGNCVSGACLSLSLLLSSTSQPEEASVSCFTFLVVSSRFFWPAFAILLLHYGGLITFLENRQRTVDVVSYIPNAGRDRGGGVFGK